MTNAEYRQAEGLSASDIKDILANPYLFKIGFKPERTPQTQARLDFGSLVHCLILEPQNFERDFAIMPELNLRKNEDKAIHAELVANEKRILVSQKDVDKAKKVAEAVLSAELPFDLTKGKCEESYFGERLGVKVKCRPDCIFDNGLIVDIKTTRAGGATADEFQKSIASFGYYIQASHYLNITKAKEFVFLAVDIDTRCIGLYSVDFVGLEFGDSEIKRAIDIYKNLDKVSNVVSGEIGHKGGELAIEVLSLPNYVFYKNGAKI